MPTVEINFLAIIIATAVSMIIGGIWYGPLFSKPWQKLVNLSDKDIANSDRVTPMVAMLILAFVQAFVLLHFVTYLTYFYPDYSEVSIGLTTGIWAWLGFVLPVMAGSYMFARRRKKLLAIDSLYSLVVLIINGVILSFLR